MPTVSITHEYSGLSDYWGGNGRRWDDDAGCLFAFYGTGTTLRDCVDEWVEDFNAGGDCDSLPDGVRSEDIRAAILESLTPQGRADYESGAIAECAADYAACNDFDKCQECDESLGERHDAGCGKRTLDCQFVVQDDCNEDEDCCESPIWVILVEVEEDEDEWDLCQYDESEALGDKSGKWTWVNGEEELGPYDSDDEAMKHNPNDVPENAVSPDPTTWGI